jgi:hypothetical protein
MQKAAAKGFYVISRRKISVKQLPSWAREIIDVLLYLTLTGLTTLSGQRRENTMSAVRVNKILMRLPCQKMDFKPF